MNTRGTDKRREIFVTDFGVLESRRIIDLFSRLMRGPLFIISAGRTGWERNFSRIQPHFTGAVGVVWTGPDPAKHAFR
jgi:hypothetical protein